MTTEKTLYSAEQLQRVANKAATVASNTTYKAARLLLEGEAEKAARSHYAVAKALRVVIAKLDLLPAIEGVGLKID